MESFLKDSGLERLSGSLSSTLKSCICSLAREPPQANKNLDISSGFKCGFKCGLSRPCRPHAIVCYFFLKMACLRLLMGRFVNARN